MSSSGHTIPWLGVLSPMPRSMLTGDEEDGRRKIFSKNLPFRSAKASSALLLEAARTMVMWAAVKSKKVAGGFRSFVLELTIDEGHNNTVSRA